MITLKGIYESGEVKLLEKIPFKQKANVLVTFIDDFNEESTSESNQILSLSGIISFRKDGSVNHDKYIY